MIVVEIVQYIILSLLSILLLVLVLPIYYAASGQRQDTAFLKAEVFGPLKWCYFTYELKGIMQDEKHLSIFGINVNIQGNKSHKKDDKDKKEKKEKKKDNKKSKKREKGFLLKILAMVQDFWKHIKPRLLLVEGRFGFEDPYHTGIACAIINCIAPYGDKYNINLTPVFDGEVIEGRFEIEGKIVPAVILWIFAKAFVIPRLKINNPLAKKTRAL
jgi:hypothetical protein